MNRVLIRGSAGFLESDLCERLLRNALDVLCIAHFFTGSKAGVAHLIGNPYLN